MYQISNLPFSDVLSFLSHDSLVGNFQFLSIATVRIHFETESNSADAYILHSSLLFMAAICAEAPYFRCFLL